MAGVFINYRSSDADYGAIAIDMKLVEHFGKDLVFRDSRAIPAGTDFPPFLWRWLDECQVLVAVIGPHWLARDEHGRRRIDDPGDYVRLEISRALVRGIPVVPVLLDDTKLPLASDLPTEISGLVRRQYRHVRRRSIENDLAGIVSEIDPWVTRQDPPPSTPVPPREPTIVTAPIIGRSSGPATYGPNSPMTFGNGVTPWTES